MCYYFGNDASDCPPEDGYIEDDIIDTTGDVTEEKDEQPDIDPDLLTYGIMCTNNSDGLCGYDCEECHWSWPTSDPDECSSVSAACRCKPEPIIEPKPEPEPEPVKP